MKGFNFYNSLRTISRILFKHIWKMQIVGIENIPDEGPLIIVANHSSLLDGFVMVAAFEHTLTFLSAAYLFDIPVVGFILRKIKAIPVSTSKKTVSTRKTVKDILNVLENNGILMIFPEGGLRKTNEIVDMKSGASFFSVKTKVPILPVAINGTKDVLNGGNIILRRRKIIVNIGCVINTVDDVEKMSYLIKDNLKTLMNGDLK